MLSLILHVLFDKCLSNISEGFITKEEYFSSGRRLDFDLSFGFNFRWAFVESLDVHLKVHYRLMAQVTEGAVFQVERIFVTLHVSFSWKDFVTNITRKLATLALVYFWYVDPEVLLVTEIFITHPAHELFASTGLWFILLSSWHRKWTWGGWQQQFGNLHRWSREWSCWSLGRTGYNIAKRLGSAHNNLGCQRVVVDCCCD